MVCSALERTCVDSVLDSRALLRCTQGLMGKSLMTPEAQGTEGRTCGNWGQGSLSCLMLDSSPGAREEFAGHVP